MSSTPPDQVEEALDYGFASCQFELLSNCYLRESAQIETIFTRKYKTLIILGNMIHGDNRSLMYEFIYRATCIYDRIYYVLGEYEFMSDTYTMTETITYMKYLASLYDAKHVTILNNTTIIDHHQKLVIFGSPFWSHVDQPYTSTYASNIRVSRHTPLTAVRHNLLHYQAIQLMEKSLTMAHNYGYSVIVLTSYAPDHLRHDGNTYLSSDWDTLMTHPHLWVWVMGGRPVVHYIRQG